MASPKTVDFTGVGWSNRLFLSAGNNFVSIPRAVENWQLSDLAAHMGAEVSAIYGYDAMSGQFVRYESSTPAGSPADLPVSGGSGYMIVMTNSATAEFDKPAWESRRAEAIPTPLPHDKTPFLLIEGLITAQGMNLPLDGLSVSVTNLGTGLRSADITGQNLGNGRYSVVFADFAENRAAQVGDELRITVTDPKAALGARILSYQLTTRDIQSGKVSLNFGLSSTPVASNLLPAYPNPFMDRVWIPYQLARPGNVVVSIHDLSGRLVHTVDVGHRPAGIYVDENEAAYWNGRNLHGEKAANGIYFYSIRSGSSVATATRKLVFLSK
jgi:hypothetical protein